MYKLLRSAFFLFEAEKMHHFSMDSLKFLCNNPITRSFLQSRYKPKNTEGLKRKLFGLSFNNPIGLAAGFDKNAKYLRELEILGFGFIEIGTVTPRRQAGNDKPRLFRLPKDKAIINRMGFNNDGVKVVAERLKKWRSANPGSSMIIGGNIGKNKNTPNEDAWQDYETCFKELFDYVDYFVVNVSSPNTPGLRQLQEKSFLFKIFNQLKTVNNSHPQPKPLLLKIAPDLSNEQLNEILNFALEIKLDGLVVANTTVNRDLLSSHSGLMGEHIGHGGLSGKPLRDTTTDIVRYLHKKSSGGIPIIASGGVFNSEDAQEKLDAGASLVQVWTGLIYEGPKIVKKICKHLN